MAVFKGARSARNSSFDLVLGGSGLVGPVTWFLAKLAKARDDLGFSDAVVSICHGGQPGAESCRAHAENFSWPAHGVKLLNALDLGVEQTGG